jgi:sensor domain CHASE-containing protein
MSRMLVWGIVVASLLVAMLFTLWEIQAMSHRSSEHAALMNQLKCLEDSIRKAPARPACLPGSENR